MAMLEPVLFRISHRFYADASCSATITYEIKLVGIFLLVKKGKMACVRATKLLKLRLTSFWN
jgi:hypothetical protein